MRDDDLHDEIEAHLEERALDLIEAGVPDQEAWRRARLEFGNRALVAESSREVWRWMWLDRLGQDLRYALRQMRRSPGFVLVAVLSLALGIGANTAVFSVVDALLLRRLPVAEPDRLVFLDQPFLNARMNIFAYRWLERLRQADVFAHVSGIAFLDRFNVAAGGADGVMTEYPDRTAVALVSGDYFVMFGVGVALGRPLTSADDRTPGGHPVAVISHRFWRSRFESADDVAGRSLRVNGVVYTVVGVAPPGFVGDEVGFPIDVWIPLAMQSQVMPERPGLLTNVAAPWIRIVARLKPGASLEQTRRHVSEIAHQLEEETASRPLSREDFAEPGVLPAARGDSSLRQIFGDPLRALLCIVGLLLLIACANIANLLLARSATRQREMAVRLSLGAGRARIVRQLMTENILLACVAGSAAVVIGLLGAHALERMLASGQVPLELDVQPNARMLGFTILLSSLTTLAVGLAPARRSSPVAPSPALTGSVTGARERAGFSRALVVLQVALVLVLLIGAGLFVQTLRNLKGQDLGFERSNLWMVRTAPNEIGRLGPAIADEYRAVQDRIKTLPGVVAVGASTSGVLARTGGSRVTIPGYVPRAGETMLVDYNLVAAEYFGTIGMTLMSGRVFTERDREFAPGVAIVSEAMARRYFGGPNAVGKTFSVGRDDSGTSITIVGVVKDAKYDTLRDDDISVFYRPAWQDASRVRRMDIAVRVSPSAPLRGAQIRDAIHAFDPALPILSVEPLEKTVDRTLLQERLAAGLSSWFAVIAVLSASVGLYGVLSHAVTRRTNEIGVRMALGAGRFTVSAMVINWCLAPVAAGLILGIPAALIAGRAITSALYGIQPTDILTMLGACLLVLAVAIAAAYVPARRASRVDPMVALRHE